MFNEDTKVKEYIPGFVNTSVSIVKGKVISIAEKDNNLFVIDDPKIVIDKRKELLVTLGIIKKYKYVVLINEKGDFIQDKNQIKELTSMIDGKSFIGENILLDKVKK
ncbi:MAG: hypothetical protein AB8U25_03640 [Rickettsiales endosymbiont of Dermacentor nuttalli]